MEAKLEIKKVIFEHTKGHDVIYPDLMIHTLGGDKKGDYPFIEFTLDFSDEKCGLKSMKFIDVYNDEYDKDNKTLTISLAPDKAKLVADVINSFIDLNKYSIK